MKKKKATLITVLDDSYRSPRNMYEEIEKKRNRGPREEWTHSGACSKPRCHRGVYVRASPRRGDMIRIGKVIYRQGVLGPAHVSRAVPRAVASQTPEVVHGNAPCFMDAKHKSSGVPTCDATAIYTDAMFDLERRLLSHRRRGSIDMLSWFLFLRNFLCLSRFVFRPFRRGSVRGQTFRTLGRTTFAYVDEKKSKQNPRGTRNRSRLVVSRL